MLFFHRNLHRLGLMRTESKKKHAICVPAAATVLICIVIFICFIPYDSVSPRIVAHGPLLNLWTSRIAIDNPEADESSSKTRMPVNLQKKEVMAVTIFKPSLPSSSLEIINTTEKVTTGSPAQDQNSKEDGLKNIGKNLVGNDPEIHENISISELLIPTNIGNKQDDVCDIYSGDWVLDNFYPLYEAGKCPYVSGDFNCKNNDRPDSEYQKWRWQPRHCNIPRFNASEMLKRLKGKRLMFVGDSLNRNQWESMLCLLRASVEDDRKSMGYKGPLTIFKAEDYNSSVEFFWAPFLVEQESISVQGKRKEILRLDVIENHGSHWKDADILVFNTGHWWTHGNKVTARDFFQEGTHLYSALDSMVAFRKALKTWADWIDSNVDSRRTQVYFRGFSPTHFSANQWKRNGGHRCYNETEPIASDEFINGYPWRMRVVEDVLEEMKFPVSLMNITRMSDFRKDAHPSVYTLRKDSAGEKKKLTMEQRNDPEQFADCSHWCLPGLPDIWNELLYASFARKQS
eukprot:Gb_36284 [translate_table: standard]